MDFGIFATKTEHIVKRFAKNFDKKTLNLQRSLQRKRIYTIVKGKSTGV